MLEIVQKYSIDSEPMMSIAVVDPTRRHRDGRPL
jgi:hypothetical protein